MKIVAPIIVCLAISMVSAQDWKRSEKKDNIQTYYETEKTASDQFDVSIEVRNNRSKSVRVTVRAKYNRPRMDLQTGSGMGSFGNRASGDECTVVVAPDSTAICSVTVEATKVTGVKIVRWENANSIRFRKL